MKNIFKHSLQRLSKKFGARSLPRKKRDDAMTKWEVEYYQFGTDEMRDALTAGWEPYAVHFDVGQDVIWVHVRRKMEE